VRLEVVRDEDTSVPQTRAGQRLLQGYAVALTPEAMVVLGDVVAALAEADTAEDVGDYVMEVLVRVSHLYGIKLDSVIGGAA
jgi:hypothetical protein